MTKWDTLLAGGNIEAKEIGLDFKAASSSSDFGFVPIGMIVIFVVVFAVFVASTNATSNANRVDTITHEVGVVVKKTVDPEPIMAPAAAKVALVKAKFAGKQMWSDEAVEDDETYGEFARTIDNGREMPLMERAISQNARHMNDQLEPMREALKKSGKSLAEFMTENDAYVPDALLDVWAAESTVSKINPIQILDDEERIIARDAFEVVPMKASVEEAVMILRDVLASRSEASKRGLMLPEMPAEQKASLKYWSTQQGPASKIAQSILQKL